MRALAVFLCGGLALVGVRRAWEDPARDALTVRVPEGVSEGARERLIDEAVLVEVGLGLGWRQDPLIRDRLMRTMAQLGPTDVAADLLERAAAIDLPRRDPLVRARLIERARRTLPEPGTPSESELETFARAHAERFSQPLMVTFEHRFAPHSVAAERLANMHADARDGGLPELTLGPRPTRSLPALARTVGAAAAGAIAAAELGVWTRVDSPVGHHFVRVLGRAAPAQALGAIREQVLAGWREARRPELEREGLSRLRASFDIEVLLVGDGRLEAAAVVKSGAVEAGEATRAGRLER